MQGIRGFYDLLHGPAGPRVCTGTACRFGGGPQLDPGSRIGSVHCLGRCYDPPARTDGEPTPIPRRSLVDSPVVLRHLVEGASSGGREDYDLPDGETILRAVADTGLRGRGG
ncbi:MAG: hypothetical protein L0323_09630, partial [Planctomycetes bacterium]|nr:hypothetical protein [Planctomycetota bacterium]